MNGSQPTDQLMPQEVLPRRDAGRDLERYLALVRPQAVDSPRLVAGVQAVLVDLEPLEAGDARLCCVCDFCSV